MPRMARVGGRKVQRCEHCGGQLGTDGDVFVRQHQRSVCLMCGRHWFEPTGSDAIEIAQIRALGDDPLPLFNARRKPATAAS